jgi:hypothetical protein
LVQSKTPANEIDVADGLDNYCRDGKGLIMISKCECQHCGGSIEFDADTFDRSSATSHRVLGNVVECAHCHQQTQLYLNLATFVAPKNPAGFAANLQSPKSKLIPCEICGNQISRTAWFCFQCGQFHYSLFRIVWDVMCNIAAVGLIFSIIGWIILKLVEAAGS